MGSKIGSLQKWLIITSFLEGSTGLALMTMPSFVIKLLLGSPLTDPISVIITRVGGSAVASLAIACWFSRKSDSVNGLIIALLFYNVSTVVLFGYAGMFENLNGIAMWPAVAIHVAMAMWGVKLLNKVHTHRRNILKKNRSGEYLRSDLIT